MNSEYEKRLEAEVTRALRRLPEMPAPATLSSRVKAAIQAREQRAWIHNPWPMWPAPLRYAAFLGLWVLFGGVCFAAWLLCRSEMVTAIAREATKWLAGVAALGRSLDLVLGLFRGFLQNLQPAVLYGCLAGAVLTYGVFVALASFYLRLGLATATDELYETYRK